MNTPISQLITMPEGKTLEFKRDISSPKNIIKTLVAFANTAGGRLVIGVEDDTREVRGVVNPLDEEERLCDLIADGIAPRLVPNVELMSIEDKTLLSVEVYPSGQRPHWVKKEGHDEGVYVRLGSTNRKADRELIAELKRTSAGTSFDELPLPDLSVEALDIVAAKELFKGKRELGEREIVSLKMLAEEQGHLVPTIGGVLLFGKEREERFPDVWIQCGRFEGTTKSVIFDHIEIHEHLPIAVEHVIDFIKKHSMRGADLSQIKRRDVWSIPLDIVREAVINAIVHSDYSQIGAPLRVAIYDDRVEIENPGILVPGMTVEDVKQGVSKIRNRVIARVFRELGLVEQWGSGVPRIFEEAESLQLPEPKIEEIGMRVRFTIYLKESAIRSLSKGPSGNQVGTKSGPSRDQVGTKFGLTTEQIKVLHACVEDSGILELMSVTERSNRTKFRNNVLIPLLSNGFIEMTIPEKPTSSKQKYRLTPNGRAFLTREKKVKKE
ncbi:AlbA family DNA-binding domain-containing protein [Methanolobus chelungpuianus]|uniref:ATPase AAA n=1 Tax=Methanolobus chelungpuianus TaxID=502115 RepID=A0AAE3HCI2_9EURY|nr:helix-turn-helix domain-containing protein [Methanolobus chelungpuianus]MCQ6963687.1 ATPase AAA [Methanolobus chelungpuianus]